MIDLFSDDIRRNPYPLYDLARRASPLLREPRSGHWMVFDYEGVKRVLSDAETFSSRYGPADWMIFQDPPRHSRMRALVSRAFTPRSITSLESRVREVARDLLDAVAARGEMDLPADFAAPLPMRVIAEMLGVSSVELARFQRWNDAVLNMSYLIAGAPNARAVMDEFTAATGEMSEYLLVELDRRRAEPADDLLFRLLHAEMNGQRLGHEDILGFFQLLLLAGSETTTNLINNAVLCLTAHPEQMEVLLSDMSLLPSAIEEVLRYRSPFQWMFRLTTRDVELRGQTVPRGQLVLAMMGSANHDPEHFPEPARFDVRRQPNAHLAFGHGNHFCLGAPLARLEARVALTELLQRCKGIRLCDADAWEPRKGLHVHGPARLPIRFEPAQLTQA